MPSYEDCTIMSSSICDVPSSLSFFVGGGICSAVVPLASGVATSAVFSGSGLSYLVLIFMLGSGTCTFS